VSTSPALRAALADPNRRLVATFVLIPRVEVVESLAYAGFDAVVLDLEHAPIGPGDLPGLVAAGQGAGAYVLARLGDRSPATVGMVLDTGVDGVVVPHVGDAATAGAVVRAGRFPPDGDRSLNPYVRAASYLAGDSFTNQANDDVAVLVMVEGEDGLGALDEISGVPGVDAVFVGPVDLSASLGRPGQPEHPEVVATVEGILGKLGARGVASAVYCPTPAAARRWQGCGARLVVLSADVAMAHSGYRHYLRDLRDRPDRAGEDASP
jgi:2-keto-3-deoxy-L-rhamnonate aldolase RhmA